MTERNPPPKPEGKPPTPVNRPDPGKPSIKSGTPPPRRDPLPTITKKDR